MANNGKQPLTNNLKFERTPVRCQRCEHLFKGFVLEVLDGLVQLRCGDVLISRIEMVCLHCSFVFRWEIREKDLENIAASYKELLNQVKPYAPE